MNAMAGFQPVRQFVMTGAGAPVLSVPGLAITAAGTALGAVVIHNVWHLTWPWSIGLGFLVGPLALGLGLFLLFFVAAELTPSSVP